MRSLWGRILIAGFLSEVLLLVILNGVRQLYGPQGDSVVVFTGGFALPLVAALWVCRKASSRFVLHGALVGVAAVLFYTALTLRLNLNGQLPLSAGLFAAHFVKILGGAAGGFVVGNRLESRA
jgi:hypothetical protein